MANSGAYSTATADDEILALRQRLANMEQEVAALRSQVSLYQHTLDLIPDLVVIRDSQTQVVYANPAFQRYHQIGGPVPEADDLLATPSGAELTDSPALVTVAPRADADGNVRVFRTITAVMPQRPGTLDHTISIARDITALQQTTAALQSSEVRYRNMVANAPGMVYQLVYRPDGSGGFTFVSDGCRAIYGLSPAEILARPESVFNVVHPEDRAEIDRTIAEATAELKSWSWAGRIVLPSGAEKWLQCKARPTHLDDGTIIWDGLLMDITDRKQTELELGQQRERLTSLLTSLPGVVWEVWLQPDPAAGRINFVSDYLRTLLGYTMEEWHRSPNTWLEVMDIEQRAEILHEINSSDPMPPLQRREFRWRAKDGTYHWVAVHLATINDPDGTMLGWRGVALDITDQKRAEEERSRLREELIAIQERALQEMRAAKAVAEAANQAKTLFLSTMSHELRTPLTSVIGYSELLLRDLPHRSAEEIQQDIQLIRTASQHLLTLINTILDLSKIEAGKMELQSEPVDTDLLLDEVLLMVRPLAGQQGNALEVLRPDELPPMHSDRTKVRQVLLNLLANAAKFTSAGRIALEAHPIDHAGEPGVQFRVSDSGPGIAPNLLPRLFEPFVQDPEVARQRGGTGLGLALSRRLCRLMGGDISVESRPGAGSIFTVRLPLKAPAPPANSPE
jgi:PAS domain S-box-containing protein